MTTPRKAVTQSNRVGDRVTAASGFRRLEGAIVWSGIHWDLRWAGGERRGFELSATELWDGKKIAA